MKIKTEGYYPFVVTAETKKSQAGNDYLSIGVGMSKKNQNGEYETTWFNMIEKKDLLMLASVCERAFHMIVAEDNKEHKSGAPASAPAPQQNAPQSANSDDIPF